MIIKNKPSVVQRVDEYTFDLLETDKVKPSNKLIKFGTAGMRGKNAPGINNINADTILMATQALIEYYRDSSNKKVVVGYDNRLSSKYYAMLVVIKLQEEGFEPIMSEKTVPTPVLSLAVNKMKALAGVMITASHNSMEYNGYKLFLEGGYQATSKVTDKIYEIMQSDIEVEYPKPELILANIQNTFNALELFKEFITDNYLEDYSENKLNILFSGMCGVGQPYVEYLLNTLFKNEYKVDSVGYHSQSALFVESVNPEEDSAWYQVINQGKSQHKDLLIAVDPDSDRVAFCVKSGKRYRRLSGQEISILLTAYLTETKDVKPTDLIVKTNVTTDFVKELWPGVVEDVPVGFKNIAQKMSDNFVAGFEESCSFNMDNKIHDKDPFSTIICMVKLANLVKDKYNQTLCDYLESIYDEHCVDLHFETLSYTGDNRNSEIIEKVNSFIDDDIYTVHDVTDGCVVYKGEDKLVKTTIRESGTEPKTKLYIEVTKSR